MTKEEMAFGGHNVYRFWGHPFGRHAAIWLFHYNQLDITKNMLLKSFEFQTHDLAGQQIRYVCTFDRKKVLSIKGEHSKMKK